MNPKCIKTWFYLKWDSFGLISPQNGPKCAWKFAFLRTYQDVTKCKNYVWRDCRVPSWSWIAASYDTQIRHLNYGTRTDTVRYGSGYGIQQDTVGTRSKILRYGLYNFLPNFSANFFHFSWSRILVAAPYWALSLFQWKENKKEEEEDEDHLTTILLLKHIEKKERNKMKKMAYLHREPGRAALRSKQTAANRA